MQPVNFEVNDYVLVSGTDGRPRQRNKLQPRWQGPAQIVEKVSDLMFKVVFVGSDREAQVHVTRLRYFDGPDAVMDAGVQAAADKSYSDRYMVADIVDLQRQPIGKGKRTQLKFLVHWEGYGPEEATWAPIKRLYEDVPAAAAGYLEKKQKTDKLAQEARKQLGL